MAAAALAFLASVALLSAHYFLWIRSSRGQAIFAGQPLASARVYTNRQGSVMVLTGAPASSAYVISPRENAIGIPMEGFWLKTSPAIGLKGDSIQWIREGMKSRYDPRLHVDGSSAEFVDFEGGSIRVTW